MKLVYKGAFSGNVEDIPHGEHKPGAVKFKEIDDPKRLALVANAIALGITLVCVIAYGVRAAQAGVMGTAAMGGMWLVGAGLALLSLFPHELLHAVCMRGTVYLYTNLKQGMLFVTGPEDMSKARFVFMSLLPNLVFGVVPFTLGMIWPQFVVLGVLGALSVGAGAGDYYNVFNALTQMPRGTRTYLYGFNSYWYDPKEETA